MEVVPVSCEALLRKRKQEMWRKDKPSSLTVTGWSGQAFTPACIALTCHRHDLRPVWGPALHLSLTSMRMNSSVVHRWGGWGFMTSRWCVHFIISVTDIQCYSAIQCCRRTVLLLRLWLLRLKVKGGCVLQSPWLQRVLPCWQRRSPWWQRSQKLTVDLPSDLLCHALTNLLDELL